MNVLRAAAILGAIQAAIVAIIVASCVGDVSSTDGQFALRAAESGWDAAGLPPHGECLRDVRVKWADDAEEFVSRCTVSPEYAASCLTTYDTNAIGGEAPLVMISPGRELDRGIEPISHEAMHKLIECHLRRPLGDPYDAQHTDHRVWESGGPSSAQQRARDLYFGE